MVSNVTIDRLCAHLTNYRGCFSLDQIFGIKREGYKAPSSFVINTFESKYVNGGHWLLATLWGDHIEIFDSLGQENEIPKKIIEHLSKMGPIRRSRPQLQDFFSPYCGFYVIGRLISIYRGQSLSKFLSNFGKDTSSNDALIKHNVLIFVDTYI